MKPNEFTEWLKSKATNILESYSTDSDYYTVNGIKIRVSDHITIKDDHDLDVIFVNDEQYIIIPTNARYKKPTLCSSVEEGQEFIRGWMVFAMPYISTPVRHANDGAADVIRKVNEDEVREASFKMVYPMFADSMTETTLYADYMDILHGLKTPWFPKTKPNVYESIMRCLVKIAGIMGHNPQMLSSFVEQCNCKKNSYKSEDKLLWLESIIKACVAKKKYPSEIHHILMGTNTTGIYDPDKTKRIPTRLDEYMKEKGDEFTEMILNSSAPKQTTTHQVLVPNSIDSITVEITPSAQNNENKSMRKEPDSEKPSDNTAQNGSDNGEATIKPMNRSDRKESVAVKENDEKQQEHANGIQSAEITSINEQTSKDDVVKYMISGLGGQWFPNIKYIRKYTAIMTCLKEIAAMMPCGDIDDFIRRALDLGSCNATQKIAWLTNERSVLSSVSKI